MNATYRIEIVESRQNDLVCLQELFLKVRRNTFSWLDSTRFDLADFVTLTEGEYILVALIDDKPVGFISVWLADHFIHHLYVDEDYQHVGVGTTLLTTIIDKIGLPVRLKCVAKNETAIRFYLNRGFINKGKGVSEDGEYLVLELHN